MTKPIQYDVAIVGAGPAGLSASLALGRACKRVLLCDSGPRRNAAAVQMHNFVTRDGTPPDEFRGIARQQLKTYPEVDVRDVRVESIQGTRGNFIVQLTSEVAHARRILLCTGLIDEMLPIPGFRELWGKSIFQCPYCHGWESRDRPWGYLALSSAPHVLPFVLQARGWARELTVFTGSAFEFNEEALSLMASAGIRIETAPVTGLQAPDGALEAVELATGARVRCDALFVHPPQRQVELVRALGVQLDEEGYVQVDPFRRETSVPGIYASGDLTTRMQAAVLAAASGMQAAAALNVDLMMELASTGKLASGASE